MSAFERGFVNTLMLRERFNKNNSASISRICVLRQAIVGWAIGTLLSEIAEPVTPCVPLQAGGSANTAMPLNGTQRSYGICRAPPPRAG